jgi:hypothetical protein
MKLKWFAKIHHDDDDDDCDYDYDTAAAAVRASVRFFNVKVDADAWCLKFDRWNLRKIEKHF